MNVDTKWYYADGENVVGPFDHTALEKLIRAGLVQGETQIAEQGEQTWCRIDETPFRELLPANATLPAAPVLPPPSSGGPPPRFKHILDVLLHAAAALLRLGWEKVKRFGLLFWKFRSQASKPWRYAIDGFMVMLVIGSGFAVSSLNNPEADEADGWYGYGYNIGDYCVGKVNSGELARTDATSGRELWSLVNVIESEKVNHLSTRDRSACEEGYFDGLYGRRAKHPARVTAP